MKTELQPASVNVNQTVSFDKNSDVRRSIPKDVLYGTPKNSLKTIDLLSELERPIVNLEALV